MMDVFGLEYKEIDNSFVHKKERNMPQQMQINDI
jgi:hypothetical protein